MKLTLDETEILNDLARGRSAKWTYTRIGICHSTYFRRREKLMRKLGAKNETQLGMLAVRYGLLPQPGYVTNGTLTVELQ